MPPTLCIWHSVGGIFSSQEVIQKIHALNLLLEICAPVHIQGKRYVLMSEDFRKRLYIKLRYLDCPNCECMTDLMKLHFLQSVPLQETCEKLPICSRLGWLGLAREEIVIWVFRVKLFDNVHEKRRNRNRSSGGLRLRRSYMKIRFFLLLVIDTLDGFVDADGLVRQRNVPHLQAAQLAYPDSGKQCNQNPRCLPVQVHVDTLD